MFHANVRRIPLWVAGLVLFAGCESSTTLLSPDEVHLAQQANSEQQINLTFDKSLLTQGTWTGTVSGDIEGDLRTELYDLRVTGDIWHVGFLWIIDPDGAEDRIIADLTGTLNTVTGSVVMNGTVTSDESGRRLLGAQVHEEGQLVDPATLRFTGMITIMAPSAD